MSGTGSSSTLPVYEDQGPAIVGVSIGLLVLAIILVVIRMAYRMRSLALGMDDWLICIAVVCVFFYNTYIVTLTIILDPIVRSHDRRCLL